MGTKRISQLDTIADALVTGEAILPIVISDPLIPNRKAKVSQLFRSISAGSQSNPGLAFDLDRDTGLYQSAPNEIGITFGSAALYNSRNVNTDGSSTLGIRAIDTASANSNIEFTPQGSGYFTVGGLSLFTDSNFYLQGDQNPGKRVVFNVDTVSTAGGTRRFDFPSVGSSTSATLVGADTFQTLTNKTIIIKDNELSIVGSTNSAKIAKFETDAWDAPGQHIYRLPDFGASESQSTLLDDITEQNVYNKNMVNPTFSNTPSTDENDPTRYVIFDSSRLTQDRAVIFPDLNVIVVGEDSSQTLSNKTYKGAIFEDTADASKKITFALGNLNSNSNLQYTFPEGSVAEPLNNGTQPNVLVAERATQTLAYKTMEYMSINNPDNVNGIINIDASNIEEQVTIRFPAGDATLLSTNNIDSVGVSFGGPIAAPTLGGRLRLQSYFQAGW
ncbi:YadA domain-containing structural protein [Synechococcus phage S-SZBM1]|uniref:YadA domain-containing structural protein n=1 Tax=Synechococcus phage S-SZBM1 TaxID=2926475 RepID=A0AC61TSF3_9CAUD|nr:YadA domain-containing structural protein [Synechococcus phage S-SZBM1]UNH61171.1 YadA domain-containing structural protein [Synechococcus phage S-SZBM1]